jgi:CopG family transcriptional regulator, nickel-responsive regulator
MHAHLDHDHCIESVMLKGRSRDVRQFADAISAERGVKHGLLNLVTVEIEHPSRHIHSHLTPNH